MDEIEELGKKIHQFAELFEMCCKLGDGYDAAIIIGRLQGIMPELKEMAMKCNGHNILENDKEDGNHMIMAAGKERPWL